jgi:hypothetical protein
MFLFIPSQNINLLKNLKVVFQSVAELNDPYIVNKKIHRSYQETELSESEFETALFNVYEKMEANIKAMVTWEYYLQQAKQNREKIEASLIATQVPAQLLAEPKQYSKVGVLRLFSSLQETSLWEAYGERHQGIAVELDETHEYFSLGRFDNGPQLFQPIKYDDLRPPLPTKSQPFPAIFCRPEHFAYERESRLVRVLKEIDQSEAFKLPKAAIKGIYLGLDCPRTLVEELAQLVKMDLQFRHVLLKQMAVSETHLRLQPLDLSDYL